MKYVELLCWAMVILVITIFGMDGLGFSRYESIIYTLLFMIAYEVHEINERGKKK